MTCCTLITYSFWLTQLRDAGKVYGRRLKNKASKVHFGEIKVFVSGGSMKNRLSESKVYQREICSLRVKSNTALCVKCDKRIYGCARVMRVTPKI